jgi:beta-phosphoglucomutase-like phosphatase (HAD superfamily)
MAELDDLREVQIISDLARSAHHLMPIAVASGGPAAIALPSLARTGLAELFAAIVTIDDGGRAKPAPDLFLTASTRLGVPPEACLVIEDSRTGIDAARAAGMAVIDVHDGAAVADLARRLHLLSSWRQALA